MAGADIEEVADDSFSEGTVFVWRTIRAPFSRAGLKKMSSLINSASRA